MLRALRGGGKPSLALSRSVCPVYTHANRRHACMHGPAHCTLTLPRMAPEDKAQPHLTD